MKQPPHPTPPSLSDSLYFLSSLPLTPFTHIYVPVFPRWAQSLCLPPVFSYLSPPFRLIFPLSYCSRGAYICHGACRSRGISSTSLLLVPCLSPLSDLCSPIALFEFACGTAGSPPSLDTVSDSLRIRVYRWQDACLQRHCKCGCLP